MPTETKKCSCETDILEIVEDHLNEVYDKVREQGGQGSPYIAVQQLERKLKRYFQEKK